MIRILYFLLLITFAQNLSAGRTELAICAIFRDEAPYLAEWIDFHEKQGVKKFYLYNNLSQDNYREVLRPYIIKGTVLLVNWKVEQKNLINWNEIQCSAYMHCAERIRNKVKWCAFLDTDEYLFCPNGDKLTQYLSRFSNYPGVSVNWVMYGTSNVESIPEGLKMTDLLTFRSEYDHPENLHVKTIARVSEIKNCVNPHFFIYKNNQLACNENFETNDYAFTKTNSVNHIRINHYWSRDQHFFETKKCLRYKKWGYDESQYRNKVKDMSLIYDPLSNYIP